MTVRFGLTADDYRRYRAGYPEELFERLRSRGFGASGQRVLDLGTGTGYLGRGFASRGSSVVGLDPAPELLEQARNIDQDLGLDTEYVVGKAEEVPFEDEKFDAVTAGQCWHWFDRPAAAREARRMLKDQGALLIAHFDWIPLDDNVAAVTEDLILRFNPKWRGARGTGMYPQWLEDVALAGFDDIETFTFDVQVPYPHEAWRGRIRASAGVGASLPSPQVKRFDAALAEVLKERFPAEPLQVLHRTFALTCTKA